MRLPAKRARDAVHASRRRGFLLPSLLITWLSAPCGAHAGTELTIGLRTADRQPVAGAVATATRLDGPVRSAGPRKPAVMDQVNKAFVPQILVVEAGTPVEFPNSDTVSHQVYSFSPARRFQLPLYRGEVHSPIVFDQPGVVVLGCNIHDTMVGYIFVADTPHAARTGAEGEVQFEDLPAGRYRVQVWSPAITDEARALSKEVEVGAGLSVRVDFRLIGATRNWPASRQHPDGWDAY